MARAINFDTDLATIPMGHNGNYHEISPGDGFRYLFRLKLITLPPGTGWGGQNDLWEIALFSGDAKISSSALFVAPPKKESILHFDLEFPENRDWTPYAQRAALAVLNYRFQRSNPYAGPFHGSLSDSLSAATRGDI